MPKKVGRGERLFERVEGGLLCGLPREGEFLMRELRKGMCVTKHIVTKDPFSNHCTKRKSAA